MIIKDKLSLFKNVIDDTILDEIAKTSILKTYKSHSTIIDFDDKINFVPILLSGTIKVFRENNNQEILLYILSKGDACAMSMRCCISNSISNIKAIADEDTEVLMIPIEQMQHWMNNKSWLNYIFKSYQVRFNEMLETIDAIAFKKMDERLLNYIINTSQLNNTNLIQITHQQIAIDLNTSRVVISRLLKQLEKQSKIKLGRNKIELLQGM